MQNLNSPSPASVLATNRFVWPQNNNNNNNQAALLSLASSSSSQLILLPTEAGLGAPKPGQVAHICRINLLLLSAARRQQPPLQKPGDWATSKPVRPDEIQLAACKLQRFWLCCNPSSPLTNQTDCWQASSANSGLPAGRPCWRFVLANWIAGIERSGL